jgi:hypothetical protein
MVTLFILPIPEARAESSIIITKEQENICLSADHVSIEDIAQSLERECGITISGAAWPKEKLISLHACESMESLVRQICRSIPQKSHALVFAGERLSAVYIIPGSDQPSSALHSFEDFPREMAQPKEINAARVDKLLLGPPVSPLWEFQVDDLILAYNGIRITRGPLELVEGMKKTQDYDQIEIEVARNKAIHKVLVPGGMLNISTVTQTISLNILSSSFP